MTNPNSASSATPDPNSAPSYWGDRMFYILAALWFWMILFTVAWFIADFLYGVPADATLSSALPYGIMSLVFFLWVTLYPLKLFMPEWAPIVPVLMLGSVLVLHVNSPLYFGVLNTVWLITMHNLTAGQVFPWSPRIRQCLCSNMYIHVVSKLKSDTEGIKKQS